MTTFLHLKLELCLLPNENLKKNRSTKKSWILAPTYCYYYYVYYVEIY